MTEKFSLWSLFWRSLVYGMPFFLVTVIALAGIVVTPFYSYAYYVEGRFMLTGCTLLGWLAFLFIAYRGFRWMNRKDPKSYAGPY
jgi:hypothetical protein